MYLIVYVLGLTACSATHWGGDKCAQRASYFVFDILHSK